MKSTVVTSKETESYVPASSTQRENESGSIAGLFHVKGPVPSLFVSTVLVYLSASDAMCPSLSCQVPRKS